MSGLDPVWQEDMVVEMLSETEEIQNLISIIDNYGTVKKLMEAYDEVYYRLDELVSELDIDAANNLKKKIEEELDIEIEIENYPNEEDTLHDIKL